jgi:hypothetical protein
MNVEIGPNLANLLGTIVVIGTLALVLIKLK